MKTKRPVYATAHEIAADPRLYNRVWQVGRHQLECHGYSRTGNRVRFGTVAPADNHTLIVITRYIHPNKVLQETTT